MVGHHEHVRRVPPVPGVERREHGGEVAVATGQRLPGLGRFRPELVLRVVGIAQPEYGELRQPRLPQHVGQRVGRPLVGGGVGKLDVRREGTPERVAQRRGGVGRDGPALEKRHGVAGLLPGVALAQPAVLEQHHALGAGDERAVALGLEPFGEREPLEVASAAQEVALADRLGTFGGDRFEGVDPGPVLAIGDQAAGAGIAARGHRRPVDFRGRGINGVVPGEEHALARQPGEGGRIFLADRIGPQPVPHDDHDVRGLGTGPASRLILRPKQGVGEQTGRQGGMEERKFHGGRC